MVTVSVRQPLAASNMLSAIAPVTGRTFIAATFVLSGFGRLNDPTGMIGYIRSVGLPYPEFALSLVILAEIFGGLALALGYRTKLVAAALAAFTLAAAFGFHFRLAGQHQFIHFWTNVAIAGGLLQIVAFGAGRFSLDDRG